MRREIKKENRGGNLVSKEKNSVKHRKLNRKE